MMKKLTTLLMYGMLIMTITAQSQSALFISEIIDPGDEYTGRFIELYNAGTATVDFETSVYYLSRQSNGGTTWGEVQLAGAVAPGETYVVGGSAFETFYGFAPDLVTGILTGNGDDAYGLFRDGDHLSGVLQDVYGEIDLDGTGLAWEYTDSRAVRNADISTPNTVWSSDEWTIATANTTDADPGTHTVSGGTDPFPGNGDLAFAIQNDTTDAGQLSEVHILVSELVAADSIISFQYDIAYDQSVLEYAGFDLGGTIAEGGTVAVNADVPGVLSIGYMNASVITGGGTIMMLQFNTLAVDTAELLISNAYLNTIPVNDLTNGSVIVAESTPPTANITYDDTVNRFADTLLITAVTSEPMEASVPLQISMSGATTLAPTTMTRLNDTTYTLHYPVPRADGEVTVRLGNGTDLYGNLIDPVPVTGDLFSIVRFILGDVDDDGEILAYDAALALQHSVGMDPLPDADPLPWEPWRDSTANIDGQGGITAYDAGLILQYSVGIESFTGTTLKGAAVADVRVEQVGQELILYSSGDLVGMNVTANNGADMFGAPKFLYEELLTAVNMNAETYRVGLCTASPPLEGTAIMSIPVIHPGWVTLNLEINQRSKKVTIDATTNVNRHAEKTWSVYPNPAREVLFIDGLTGPAEAEVFDLQGRSLINLFLDGALKSIDLGGLEPGAYLIRIDSEGRSLQVKFLIN